MRRNTREIRKVIWLSFQKWVGIYYRGGVDLGVDNCALCNECLACDDCPVQIKAFDCEDYNDDETDGCNLTPYTNWKMHHIEEHSEIVIFGGHVLLCSECKRLAGKEMRFLGALFMEYFKEARHIHS